MRGWRVEKLLSVFLKINIFYWSCSLSISLLSLYWTLLTSHWLVEAEGPAPKLVLPISHGRQLMKTVLVLCKYTSTADSLQLFFTFALLAGVANVASIATASLKFIRFILSSQVEKCCVPVGKCIWVNGETSCQPMRTWTEAAHQTKYRYKEKTPSAIMILSYQQLDQIKSSLPSLRNWPVENHIDSALDFNPINQ